MAKRTQDEMNNALSSDEEEEVMPTITTTTTNGDGSRYERLERLKREKRLAMNRECARVRRRRKKMRMELLENRVQELTQTNGRVQEENEALLARVAQLEVELNRAKAQQALRLSGSFSATASRMPPSAASLLNGSRSSSSANSAYLAAAAAGNSSFVTKKPAFPTMTKSSFGAAAALEHAEKLRYMNMLQAQSAASILTGRDSPLADDSSRLSSAAILSAVPTSSRGSGRFY